YVFVLFDNPNDVDKTKEIYAQDATSEESIEGKGIFTSADSDPVGFIPISQVKSVYDENEVSHRITSLNDRIQDGNCINYSKCKTLYFNTDEYLQNSKIQSSENKLPSEIAAQNLSYSVYTHITSSGDATLESTPIVFGPFLAPTTIDDRRSLNQRIAIKTMCKSILQKMDEIDTERSQIIASVFGKAGEQRESLYKQMHTIFHQWEVMASSISNREYCSGYELKEDESLALEMEKEFGLCDSHQERGDGSSSLRELGGEKSTLFVYDYPLAPVNKKNINVKNSIINIEPLYKPNGSTTCLNVIQQICTKNNFVFVPFPGDANSDNINDIFKPYPQNPNSEKLMNYFHVIFTPTPESRIRLSNDDNEFLTDTMDSNSFQNNAISIEFGAIDNQIIKSFNVGTDSTKPTAESILNLQRIVDKENSDHQVKMDCSMLPVYEGRSYKATIEMLGNAQVYPMQYFYIQKAPMFGGLYQILKVSHSITPNDMTTRAEGIRMRFNQGQYGGIEPVTLDDLESLGNVSSPMEVNIETTLGSEEGYDAPAYNLSGPYNIEENELAEQLDSGLINISQYIEKKFIPYVTSSKNMSFLSSSPEHEKKMKSVGWSPGLSWCSFFVKNIYSDILKGEQRIEALKFVSGNVYQTQQNAQKGLKYFALTKKPSVGSYVIWRNVSQSTPGVIKGHAGLVLSVNGDKIRVIEGNYAAGCRGEIGVNVQSSKCGSTSVIREYDATIDSLRDGGALYLVAYITPKKIMSAEEIASQFKKFQTITDDEKSNAILDFNNLLSESEKMYVLSKFSDLEKQAIEILLKSSSFDLSRVSDTEKSKFLSYLDG
ncbi:MAG: CHAP domain-containing protein, partial [Candidatus Izemoplasmatales bacterium]